MKIVTFNLRCDNDYDAENRWQFRKGLVLDKLDAEKPDAVGFQEVTPAMGDFLKRWMSEYLFVGCGRDADYGGENNMVGIRRDRFELMSLETFWLSDTPDVPGSRYENQSECPRVCTHVILRTLDANRLFHLYNTHLDHVSDEARVLGARALMEHMKRDLAKTRPAGHPDGRHERRAGQRAHPGVPDASGGQTDLPDAGFPRFLARFRPQNGAAADRLHPYEGL